MVIDAFSHVRPERLLDAISEGHPGAEPAALRENSHPEASDPPAGWPSDYFRKFYNDSKVKGSARAMRRGLDFGLGVAGLEQVLDGNARRILRP